MATTKSRGPSRTIIIAIIIIVLAVGAFYFLGSGGIGSQTSTTTVTNTQLTNSTTATTTIMTTTILQHASAFEITSCNSIPQVAFSGCSSQPTIASNGKMNLVLSNGFNVTLYNLAGECATLDELGSQNQTLAPVYLTSSGSPTSIPASYNNSPPASPYNLADHSIGNVNGLQCYASNNDPLTASSYGVGSRIRLAILMNFTIYPQAPNMSTNNTMYEDAVAIINLTAK